MVGGEGVSLYAGELVVTAEMDVGWAAWKGAEGPYRSTHMLGSHMAVLRD